MIAGKDFTKENLQVISSPGQSGKIGEEEWL